MLTTTTYEPAAVPNPPNASFYSSSPGSPVGGVSQMKKPRLRKLSILAQNTDLGFKQGSLWLQIPALEFSMAAGQGDAGWETSRGSPVGDSEAEISLGSG